MRHKLKAQGSIVDVSVVQGGSGEAKVTLNETELSVQDVKREGGLLSFALNNRKYSFNVLALQGAVELTDGYEYHQFQLIEPGLEALEDDGAEELNSQMPGTVLKLLHKPGDVVSKGEPLLILEAMKMEHEVCAPEDGKLIGYPFDEGDRVMPGDLLVEFAPSDAD